MASRSRFSEPPSSVVHFGLTRSTGVTINLETTAKQTGTASIVVVAVRCAEDPVVATRRPTLRQREPHDEAGSSLTSSESLASRIQSSTVTRRPGEGTPSPRTRALRRVEVGAAGVSRQLVVQVGRLAECRARRRWWRSHRGGARRPPTNEGPCRGPAGDVGDPSLGQRRSSVTNGADSRANTCRVVLLGSSTPRGSARTSIASVHLWSTGRNASRHRSNTAGGPA